MIVLVDTCVWIRFLANRAPYATELDRLLEHDEASGHPFVYGELLMGDKGGRREILEIYSLIHHAAVVPHGEVVTFARERRLHGRALGGSACTCSRRRSSHGSSSGQPIHA